MLSSLQTCPVSSVFHSSASCSASAHGSMKSPIFLSMTLYGSSVGGAPSGEAPGFSPRPLHGPSHCRGTFVCAAAVPGAMSAATSAASSTRIALLRLERDRLAVGERHAGQQQLRLTVAPRPSLERQLVARLRPALAPTLGFEL